MRSFRIFAAAIGVATAVTAAPPICTPYPINTNVLTLGNKDSLKLLVIGDTGNDSAPKSGALHIAELAQAIRDSHINPDALLLVGDNFYECGVTSVTDPHFAMYAPLLQLGVPMFAVLGNHDYGDAGSEAQCTNANPRAEVDFHDPANNWRMIDRNYVLRWPGLADVAMYDTTPVKNGCGDAQPILNNLQSSLAAMPAGEWRIVAGHHGLFSSGEHGQSCRDAAVMRRVVGPILQSRKVDLYISGHDHDGEISNLPRRPLFVVSGSGSRIRSQGAKMGNPSFFLRFTFALITIDHQTLKAQIYDIKNKTFVAASAMTGPGANTPPNGNGSAPVPSCPPGS